MLCTLLLNCMLRVQIIHNSVREKSLELFWQIENMLEKNTQDLLQIKRDFSEDCLIRARMAAYVAQHHAQVVTDRAEAQRIAELLQVDELHFFTPEGEIYAGTHPEYYHLNFHSGQQMQFFLPMLADRSLELCQDITPNTAEQKLMQYAAVWREDGQGIVQIGVEPQRVLKAMDGRTFSSVFALIPTDRYTALYAIDPATHTVISCTAPEQIGRNADDLGLQLGDAEDGVAISHPTIGGKRHYCAVKRSPTLILARTYLESALYKQVLLDTWLLAIDIILLAGLALLFIYKYLDRKIVKGIVSINQKLHAIEQGASDVVFRENAVPELAELSMHINAMLKSVLSASQKISIALELSEIPIGIYEYTPGSKRVLMTSRIKDMLQLTDEAYAHLLQHPELIPQKEAELLQNATPLAGNIFKLPGAAERYIRFEKFTYEGSNLAILIDVTREVREKLRIEWERDMDPLTGMYNRRAFYAKMDEIFQPGAALQYGAMVIIDADQLKETNDLYGHKGGDVYLKKIGEVLLRHTKERAIAARLGGDEFALFLYGRPTPDELRPVVACIAADQDRHTIRMENGAEVTVRFSMGCTCFPADGGDYHALMKLADERMYENKKARDNTPRRP